MIQDTTVADLITSRQGPLKTWTEDFIKTHFMTLQLKENLERRARSTLCVDVLDLCLKFTSRSF